MKIQNSEVEFTFEEEKEPDYICHHRIIRFMNTPKGRRKQLMELVEVFDPKTKKLISISFDASDTKTARERSRIISYLIKRYMNHHTLKIMQLPFVINGDISSFCFGTVE